MQKLFFICFLFSFLNSNAQNVGIGTNTPDPSAKLEISSNNSGFLPPRMTTAERDGIVNPAAGLQIYNTTTDCLEIFGRGKWNTMYCVPVDSTTLVTDIDGHVYPTVKICDQTWMAKNLDVARFRNGDIIPQVTDANEWANLTTGAWCWYNNDSANGAIYGRLYNWYAVNDPRGLAPEGWHVPSDGEWNKLVICLDTNADTSCLGCFQDSIAGGKLKSTYLWLSPNTGASNSSNFNALPGGFRYNNSTFEALGGLGQWWCSSPNFGFLQLYRYLSNSNGGVYRYTAERNYGHSIRCVKDTPITTLNDGLVAYYPFNGNANDESGNGNNGTVNGATLTSDRFGNSEKAYSFDGITNYISIPHSESINCSNVTISTWFNAQDFVGEANQNTLVSKREYSGWGNSYEIGLGKDPNTCFSNPNCENAIYTGYTTNNLNYINVFSSNSSLQTNNWYHFVYIHDNNYVSIFLNGVRVFLGQSPGSLPTNNTLPVWLGARPGGGGRHFFNGKLDDICIYNRALTEAEITYLATH